ncbi:MBL fold metallo-hydrolase [Streptococcus minor]|uniref:MBL fold metallo-hydrolase n=1 Tax=Streptococcus minor TaxID=229549 RepID=A0A3P1VEA1_9STRE|nr:MBL fold metallo-hydrolase [Streptococcus minor]RRD31966.1 MBL fold metallo-hydrolase [Streptococcus minor]
MKLHRITNTIAAENTYILEKDSHLMIVDPGSDWSAIDATIRRLNKPIAAILLTHTHYDHIMSLEKVRENFDKPPVYVAEKEASWLYSPMDNLSGQPRHDDLPDVICQPAEHIFQYDTVYDIAGFQFQVVETPGHSWGGVSFIFPKEELVITGDALFRETIGRYDLPTGNFEQLIEGIKAKLLSLPGHYRVYPGHGFDTTINHEKVFNPFLR